MEHEKLDPDKPDPDNEPTVVLKKSGEDKLRGPALDGSKPKQARNPDSVVRVDNEEDSLYNDGLELEDELPVLGNTRNNDNMR
jgi:hypothetical protein